MLWSVWSTPMKTMCINNYKFNHHTYKSRVTFELEDGHRWQDIQIIFNITGFSNLQLKGSENKSRIPNTKMYPRFHISNIASEKRKIED